MPPDSKQAFKAEWEALEVTDHTWALRNADVEMMSLVGQTPETLLYHQSRSLED